MGEQQGFPPGRAILIYTSLLLVAGGQIAVHVLGKGQPGRNCSGSEVLPIEQKLIKRSSTSCPKNNYLVHRNGCII